MTALLCVGNVTVDEAVFPDGRRVEQAGGDAIFAALAARLVIDDVRVCAPIGHDLPPSMLAEWQAAGLRTEDMPHRDEPTVRNVITYRADGSRSWYLVNGEAHFDRMSVYPADLPSRAADGVLVSAMSNASMAALLPRLAGRGRIYLDLQEDGLGPEVRALVRHCDVFLPSEVEARALSGTQDLAAAARAFAADGPAVVVIKKAEKGSLVYADGTLTEVPAELVTPIDSTGAGDAFCGAFAAAHLAGADPVEAAKRAASVARLAVSDHGTRGLLGAAR
ncbi:ribokinase [Actinoplanes tereljensis]|uniref:Carbohydrate kinase n=1 Tax=Paractinoplanes tereljensis TaxID=571912 RepID=A0A919NRK6_9ACTN|nr:carbohydrate kinase family protein [Actinoplanes tereljensis]GIF23844.1 carbohydrate kinase [Actinoplanes tereljensis]